MNVATRWVSDGRLNELALARRELAALGVDVVDLADTNPTRWGLGSEAALGVVADAARRSGRYDPEPRGPLGAREALAARFGGSPDDYWLTASTSEAYAWLFALLGDPGDAVGVPTPGYPLVEPLARYANLTTVGCPSHYLHPYGWTLDTEMLADVAARVKALVVVDPGNPTGAWVRDAEWAAIERTGVPVIVDQVFGQYALDAAAPPRPDAPSNRDEGAGAGEIADPPETFAPSDESVPSNESHSSLPSPASVPSEAAETALRGTFILNGLSKLLCAPGLKLAWLHAPHVARDVARTLDEIADTFLPVSAVMGAALPGLLELADDVVATTRRRLTGNLALLRAGVGDAARVRRADGGWMALVDLPWAEESDLATQLLLRRHVACHPGWFYDLPDRGVVALSLLATPDRFAEGVARLHTPIT